MTKPLWIKNPLVSWHDDAGGGLVIDGGKITAIVATGESPAGECDSFDASEHVVLPGLINTHHHFYQTLTRAYAPALNKQLFAWLKTLYPVWANLTADMVRLSSRLAFAELLRNCIESLRDLDFALITPD